MNILETYDLTKHFGARRALDSVSLTMEEGTVYGLLGPNGAGKTTFLRLVNNILVKDSGTILYRGQEMTHELGRRLGYMPEERGLYAKMSVEDQIMFFGRLKGGDKRKLRATMREYMDIFSIPQADARRKVKELSKGNQQKVQIIATLVHEPDLVILDEPFSGFDPINGALLRDLLNRLHSQGSTIVLSSHNMEAVEDICSHIALIDHGRLLVNGKLSDIKRANRLPRLEMTVSAPVDFTWLQAQGVITDIQQTEQDDATHYILTHPAEASYNDIVAHVLDQATLLDFRQSMPSLSELFIRFTSASKQS